MSKTKIHIDQLFAIGLKNLEIPVFSKDFEIIRKDIDDVASNNPSDEKKTFEDFELAVTDADWQAIKARLEEEKRRAILPLSEETFQDSFKDFEIAVTDADWQATKLKLNNSGRKKIVWWWWLNMAVIGSLIALAAYNLIPSDNSSVVISETIPAEPKTGQPIVVQMDHKNATVSPATELSDKTGLKTENTVSRMPASHTKTRYVINNYSVKNPPLVHTSVKNENEINSTENNSSLMDKTSTEDDHPSNLSETIPAVTEKQETIEEQVEPENDINSGLASKMSDNGNNNDIVTAGVSEENIIPFHTTVVDKAKPTQLFSFLLPVKPKSTLPSTNALGNTIPKSGLTYYIGLTTEIAKTGRHLSKDNEASYNTIRNDADQPITQFSFGIAAGLQKGKNQFQTGFLMTEQTFTSNYDYILKYRDSIPVYDPFGKLIGKFPIGPYKDTIISERNQITVKKIDLPFSYIRLWKLNTKTQLLTGISGVLSINTKTEGTKILNPANNQLYHYDYLKDAERKLGFSPKINIGIQRTLRKNIVLQGDLFGRYSVTNRYDTDYSAKEYPYSKDSTEFNAKEYLYSYGISIKLLYLLK